eukprot:gnl/TRDRNA2_/TRDRNA2_88811_c0_seq1.p1 gnl/TRDRNA2_/TRDRNA2_88811_c0~~gnl/TRDRNA2_/TRDRNA2_88811_c0_seq1.p1  ORF type:complete len:224 (+),score=15.27 gnl/TRDRNA2_/TRDRNA2_88811_c0_seq1:199-870(+)
MQPEPDCAEVGRRLQVQPGRLTSEMAMLLPWTKSGIDFVAPVVWDGFPADAVGSLLLASASLWLLGCLLWSLEMLGVGKNWDRWMALCWTGAGICYSATLRAPASDGRSKLVALSSYVAASSWVAAGAMWTTAGFRLIRVSRFVEGITIVLWALCGIGMLGTCLDISLSNAGRWTWASSAGWWCVGIFAWARHFASGGAFFVYTHDELEEKGACTTHKKPPSC